MFCQVLSDAHLKILNLDDESTEFEWNRKIY